MKCQLRKLQNQSQRTLNHIIASSFFSSNHYDFRMQPINSMLNSFRIRIQCGFLECICFGIVECFRFVTLLKNVKKSTKIILNAQKTLEELELFDFRLLIISEHEMKLHYASSSLLSSTSCSLSLSLWTSSCSSTYDTLHTKSFH